MRKLSVERTIRHELKSLRTQKEKVDKRIQVLERLYAELRGAEAVMLDRAESAIVSKNGLPRPPKAGTNRAAIIKILERNDGPMAVREIANKAFQSEKIKSPRRGYKGVYNIVQTVLKRNRKNTFIKVAPGQWDLRVRIEKRATKLA